MTRPEARQLHGVEWVDDYAWMHDHEDPDFLAHLRAERAFYDRATEHLSYLRDEIFSEVEQRLLPTDDSVSWRRGAFFYYARTVAGREYEQFLRTRDLSEPGQVLLDGAEFVEGMDGFVEIGLREVSPDGRLLAYSIDTTGEEIYELRFRDLTTGEDLPDRVPATYYLGAWSADSGSFFYTVCDPQYRPYQVWRHVLGGSADLVYTEPDARFEVGVRTTRDERFIVIESTSRDTGESWLVPSSSPSASPALVRARRPGIEYTVDHADGELTIVTNDGAPEFQLVRAPIDVPASREAAAWDSPASWEVVTPPQPGERLVAAHVLADHAVLELRRDGSPLLRVVDRDDGSSFDVEAGIPAGTVHLEPRFEYEAGEVTIRVESLIEPPAWYAIDLSTGVRTLRKRLTVPTHDPSRYRTERRFAPGADGTPVPVTLAWRADTPLDGTAPAVLWGYGAYESCDDAAFDPGVLSLLDRGVVYALTHPRGGGENGRAWWEAGRLFAKPTTFTDHIAVADWLAGSRGDPALVDPSAIATRGLSAGGLLQGVVYSTRPDRWRAVVAEVPFVDVVTTMLDPTIPLTINEWDEWGDPREPAMFALMRSYSPYENPPAGPRPPLLVTAARHDPRVMVREPAKWVARLRATDRSTPVLFRVELGAGAHTGPAGRFAHYRYEAEIMAFLLDALSLVES